MNKKSWTLSIPEPCDQKWSEMSVSENGRHCGQCSTEVVDFSLLSNEQIIGYLENASGKVCGRLTPAQLNRTGKRVSSQGFSGLSLPALVLLAAMSTANPVYSQQQQPVSVSAVPAVLATLQHELSVHQFVSGTLTDLSADYPLAGMQVSLMHRGRPVASATSDINGHFSFVVGKGLDYDSLLVSTYTEFPDTLIAIPKNATNLRINFPGTYESDFNVVGEVIILHEPPKEMTRSRDKQLLKSSRTNGSL